MNQKLRNPLLMSSVLAAMTFGGLNGCVVREYEPAPVTVTQAPPPPSDEVIVQNAPPEEIVETPPPAPSPDVVWVGGYWGWYGGRYAWHHGYWHRRYWGGRPWVREHWEARPRGYVFIGGHWG